MTYPHLKKYASFLIDNYLDKLVADLFKKAKELNLPVLKLMVQFSDSEIIELTKAKLLNDVFYPIIQDLPFENIKLGIERWKKNLILIEKEKLSIKDITYIHTIRASVLIHYLKYYDVSKDEMILIVEEINFYFNTCIDLALVAYEEIQRGDLIEKNKILSGILSNLPVIITTLDKNGIVTKAVGKGMQDLGLKDNETIGSNALMNNPLHAEQIKLAYNGQLIRYIGEWTKDNKIHYYENYFFPEDESNQKIIGLSLEITDQVEIQKKLESIQKEEHQKATIENIFSKLPAAVCLLTGKEGKVEMCNKKFADLFNDRIENGKLINGVWPELSSQDLFPLIEETFATGKINSKIELKWFANSFLEIFLNFTFYPFIGIEGKIEGVLLFVVDVTEQVVARKKLQESQEHLQLAFKAGKVGIWNWNIKNDTVIYSKEFYEIVGVDVSHEIEVSDAQETFLSYVHPEDRNKIIDEASKVFVEKRKDIFLEIRLNIDLKGNEICWVAERGEVFYNELGAPVRIIGTIVDITDQKRIEEELKEQKKSLETIIGINRAISSELNLENIVQYVTDAATKISGAEFGTFFYNTIGENEEELTLYTISGVPKEAFSKFPNLRKTQIVAPTFNGEQVMRVDDITQDPRYGKNAPYNGMPAGYLSVVSYLAVPVISREGAVIGGLFFAHSKPAVFTQKIEDLIVAIASQASIAMDNARLFQSSKRSEEKLSSINLELIKNNNQLTKINNDLDNFIYTASHDLKAPISNIEGLVTTLTEILVVDNDEAILILDLINKSVERFKRTIMDLTEVVKIQNSLIEDYSMVKIGDIVEEIKTDLAIPLQKNNARLIMDLQVNEIAFSIKNLRSILYNLISNSLKYRARDRNPEINITTWLHENKVIISVKDNGLGIQQEDLPKIFTIFKRMHDHVEGTGIGLTIVKRIVENSGGIIAVSSEVNVGTEFRVTLINKCDM